MRRMILPLLAAVIATPALAGGAECAKGATTASATKAAHAHEKCAMSADECRKMMADAKSRGWAGLELDKAADGTLKVVKVDPTSPASRAGFLEGDVLVALNGVALTAENHEKLAKMKATMLPGTEVLYKVDRGGKTRHLTVALGKMPEKVYEQMVARHMAEHEGAVATN
jgi:S1-C subfamily serine protease